MQIARTLANKFALTLGVAGPLLSGIAIGTTCVLSAPAASVVAPTVAPVAMHYDSTPTMHYD
jgi:hypothetical protein